MAAQLRLAERPQRDLLALLGQVVVDRLARPLQRAVDGCHRGVQRVRHLACREPEHLAHDERRALTRRQQLERGDEGQLDALALLVARGRSRESVCEAELSVRVRLDPGRLDERRVEAGGDRRAGRSRPAAAARVCARSWSGRRWSRCGRTRSAASCAPRTRQAAPGAQERLLQRVLGVVHRSEHAVAVRVQFAAARLDELAKAPRRRCRAALEQRARRVGRLCRSRSHRRRT